MQFTNMREKIFLDYVIVNNKEIDERIKLKYKYKDKTEQILLNDLEKKTIEARGIKVIEDSLIEVKNDYVRHDANHLSRILTDILQDNIK